MHQIHGSQTIQINFWTGNKSTTSKKSINKRKHVLQTSREDEKKKNKKWRRKQKTEKINPNSWVGSILDDKMDYDTISLDKTPFIHLRRKSSAVCPCIWSISMEKGYCSAFFHSKLCLIPEEFNSIWHVIYTFNIFYLNSEFNLRL